LIINFLYCQKSVVSFVLSATEQSNFHYLAYYFEFLIINFSASGGSAFYKSHATFPPEADPLSVEDKVAESFK